MEALPAVVAERAAGGRLDPHAGRLARSDADPVDRAGRAEAARPRRRGGLGERDRAQSEAGERDCAHAAQLACPSHLGIQAATARSRRRVRDGALAAEDGLEQAREAGVDVVAPQRVELAVALLALRDQPGLAQHAEVVGARGRRDCQAEAAAQAPRPRGRDARRCSGARDRRARAARRRDRAPSLPDAAACSRFLQSCLTNVVQSCTMIIETTYETHRT